jgi:hypothetical protein
MYFIIFLSQFYSYEYQYKKKDLNLSFYLKKLEDEQSLLYISHAESTHELELIYDS